MRRRRAMKARQLRVAIIGAGFGGIAAAVKLQASTNVDFVIFEQSDGVGGTWLDNRYPGCEVDIHSHAYSFSFYRRRWRGTHASQSELLRYANEVVDHFGLRPRLRLGTKVTGLNWEGSTRRYTVRTALGDDFEFDAVICALGLLNVPKYPDWPGLADFQGICFHTSRWEEHDLRGKRVAVVGTGSTAAQVVPAIAPGVQRLLVFQREPGWIEPKAEREFTRLERLIYDHLPGAQRVHRYWLFLRSIQRFRGYDAGSRMQARMRKRCLDYIQSTVIDGDTRRAVTPGYPWGCKRPVVASTFYPALNRQNVELVPHPVVAATQNGLVDDRGVEHEIDVLVLSTGFQPTQFLASLDVKGSNGQSIHDAWSRRATAFLGVTVAGFPNFFILYGPNTNGGFSVIAQLERQAEVAVRAVRRLERGATRIDTDPRIQQRYVRWIDRRIARHASAMEAGCHNYYHSPDGSNITQWPGSHLTYFLVTRLADRVGLRAR